MKFNGCDNRPFLIPRTIADALYLGTMNLETMVQNTARS